MKTIVVGAIVITSVKTQMIMFAMMLAFSRKEIFVIGVNLLLVMLVAKRKTLNAIISVVLVNVCRGVEQ